MHFPTKKLGSIFFRNYWMPCTREKGWIRNKCVYITSIKSEEEKTSKILKVVPEISVWLISLTFWEKCKIDLPHRENGLEMWENGKTWELLWRPSDEMAAHISAQIQILKSSLLLFSFRQQNRFCQNFQIWFFSRKNSSNQFWKKKNIFMFVD